MDATLTPQHEEAVSTSRTRGLLRYPLLGTFFDLGLVKSEVVSWYRIQEMFRFGSFHMYGVFLTAIPTAMLSVYLIKRSGVRAVTGEPVTFTPKAPARYRYLVGGTLFGLGWELTGACPGPIAALIGGGAGVFVVVLLSAVAGTWVYGVLQSRLPH